LWSNWSNEGRLVCTGSLSETSARLAGTPAHFRSCCSNTAWSLQSPYELRRVSDALLGIRVRRPNSMALYVQFVCTYRLKTEILDGLSFRSPASCCAFNRKVSSGCSRSLMETR